MREEVAKIIDPVAWEPPLLPGDSFVGDAYRKAKGREISLAKADAIIRLMRRAGV